MPLADTQRRLTQIGVIRLGQQVPTGNTNRRGEPTYRPKKLDRFRITSPSEALIRAVAELYGGQPQPWRGPSGPEFEVITDVRELPVLVPPQTIDPNYELWGPGFRQRLCDGVTERMRNHPCLCRQAGGEHVHEFVRGECSCGAKRECKPTVRVSVMVRDVPSIGTFKVESHGINAATYGLTSVAEAIELARVPLPGRLTMELVDKKELTYAGTAREKLEARQFWVPKLIIDWLTPGQAYGGQIDQAARQMLAVSGKTQQALPSAPTETVPERDWAAEIAAADTAVRLNNLREDMQAAGVRDSQLVEAWKARGAEIAGAAEARSVPAAPAPVEPVAAVDVVEAETEPDRDETWTAIMREAKQRNWNLPAVEAKYAALMGHASNDEDQATGWKLAEFLTAVRAGQVA